MDRYRYELFGSIRAPDVWNWGPFLRGHVDRCQRKGGLADHFYEGGLTEDPNTVFHSCDSRGICSVRDRSNVVQIIPVTTKALVRDQKTGDNSVDVDFPSDGQEAAPFKIESQSLKRKRGDTSPPGKSRKRAKEIVLKEPGHTLLEPKQTWWIREGTKVRPPLLSADGENLSYYLVIPIISLLIVREFPCPVIPH